MRVLVPRSVACSGSSNGGLVSSLSNFGSSLSQCLQAVHVNFGNGILITVGISNGGLFSGWCYGFLRLLHNLQVNVLSLLQSSMLPSSVFNLTCSLFATVNGCCSGNVSPRCYCELSGIEGFNRRVRPRLFSVLSGRLCHSTIFLLVPCLALSTQGFVP